MGGFQLTQKQRVIASAISLIPNDAVFIGTNIEKRI